MSPLFGHERPAYLLGRFIDVLTEELHQPVVAGRSVTLRRRRLRRGVEADNCYWLRNAARVQGLQRIDLRVDPPPDLAVECDVTSSSVPRMPIYAALGVPEVWRWTADGLTFHVLVGGAYQVQSHSAAFPALASANLVSFLMTMAQADDNAIVRQFREWVRQTLVPPPTP
jgi:Uma2 family endonuclease